MHRHVTSQAVSRGSFCGHGITFRHATAHTAHIRRLPSRGGPIRLEQHTLCTSRPRVSVACVGADYNGTTAAKCPAKQSKASETSGFHTEDRTTDELDGRAKARVSDQLKAAVKQVDKRVHEVTAVAVPQDVALAPHLREHPGYAVRTFLPGVMQSCSRWSPRHHGIPSPAVET